MNKLVYLCKRLDTGEIVVAAFEAEHFIEAGLQPRSLGGMPVLESYQLVNKWNLSQDIQRFVYGLY